jgi:hypothetical protein
MADSMILAGRPAVVIARMIGCHRDAIARHKRNGHVVPVVTGSPQEPPRRTEATQAKELPLTAEELLRSVIAGLDIPLDSVGPGVRLGILAERRRAASDLARIGTPPADTRDTGAIAVEAFVESGLEAQLFTALLPYPRARFDAANALRATLGLPLMPWVDYVEPTAAIEASRAEVRRHTEHHATGMANASPDVKEHLRTQEDT